MNTYTIKSIDSQTGIASVEFNLNGTTVNAAIPHLTIDVKETLHEELCQWGKDYLVGKDKVLPKTACPTVVAIIGQAQNIL